MAAHWLLSRLPKIKTWIDEHNPGDPLIPFSVALEERLAPLSAEEKEAEQKSAGAQSALGKITQAGYASLEVCVINIIQIARAELCDSLFAISPVVLMKFEPGQSARERRRRKQLE